MHTANSHIRRDGKIADEYVVRNLDRHTLHKHLTDNAVRYLTQYVYTSFFMLTRHSDRDRGDGSRHHR